MTVAEHIADEPPQCYICEERPATLVAEILEVDHEERSQHRFVETICDVCDDGWIKRRCHDTVDIRVESSGAIQ